MRQAVKWCLIVALLGVGRALAGNACIDPGEVLMLVGGADPVVVSERAATREVLERSRFSVKAGLGWTLKGTEYGGTEGGNAGISLSVPLYDPTTDGEKAKARAGLAKIEDTRRQQFLADLDKLCAKRAALPRLAQQRDLLKDKLAWEQKRIDEGWEKPTELWKRAEEVLKVEHELAEGKRQVKALAETLARTYGGEHYLELKEQLK